MGTNYHAIEPECPNPCKHCAPGKWHICKSLNMFEAHDTTPWGPIESWADWKRVILENNLQILDEYGTKHEVSDFIRDVEVTTIEDRMKQYPWLITHNHTLEDDWLDEYGFSFHRGDFC